jgi:DNA-binding NtrC family response regulator
MAQTDFSALRVLLLSGRGHAGQTVRSVLTLAGISRIFCTDDPGQALDYLRAEIYDAIFCDDSCGKVGDLAFPLAVRRRTDVLNPMVPIFVFHEHARRRRVEEARDTGATDFLTCPISPKTMMDKLEAALSHPRPFIKAPEFFGPDRRAVLRRPYNGPDRRTRTPKKVKVQKVPVSGSDIVLL